MTPPYKELADSLAQYRNVRWNPRVEDRYFQEQVLTALEALLRAHVDDAEPTETEQIIAWLERQDRIGFAFATLIKRGEHLKHDPHTTKDHPND